MAYWIAVVDDEIINLKMAVSILKDSGMKVSAARSGKEFLAFAEKNSPDLILMDIMMPDMDGLETFRRFRELETAQGRSMAPVIFLTARENAYIEKECLEIGAADFIRKPVNRDVLIHRIENIAHNNQKIQDLTEVATIDALTGFLNKVSVIERMEELCRDERGALIILDLDSFKLVNDIYGHESGDKILTAFSDILRRNMRAEDIFGRIGGDEFIVFGRDIPHAGVVDGLIQRVNRQLVAQAKKLLGEDFNIPIGVSAGAVFVPEDGGVYEEMFRQADKALYFVKQNGKHGYAVYNEEEDSDAGEQERAVDMSRLTQIFEERGHANGMMFLGQDDFTSVYRFMLRYIQSYNRVAHKALFTVIPREAHFLGSALTQMYDEFSEVLRRSLRISDFMMQTKPGQFFVLMPELSEEHREPVLKRILDGWRKLGYDDRAELDYEIELISSESFENADRRESDT